MKRKKMGHMVAPVKNFQSMADFESGGYFFFFLAKYIKGHFLGYFEGVKKVKAPTKYPLKCPIMYFIHKKLIYIAFAKLAVQ
jgi:hypothetical protein